MYIEIWSLLGIILILCIGGLVGSIVTIKMAKPIEKKEKMFLASSGEKISIEEMSILYNEVLHRLDFLSEEYLKCIKELYNHNFCANCVYFNEEKTYCDKLKIELSIEDGRDEFCYHWKFNPKTLPYVDSASADEIGAFVELDRTENN